MRVFIIAVLLLVFIAVPHISRADAGPVLLGEGCYFIPTTSTVMRVLLNAREVAEGLIADLTSGELWVVRTIFGFEPTELSAEELSAGCVLLS